MSLKIPVEISARHIHLSKKDFEKLFGEGKNKNLTFLKKISQPEQFASKEVAELINKENKIKNVRIIGPFRKKSQLEISLTDAYNLKLKPLPKIKLSGNLTGTCKVLVKGPKTNIKISCIIAKRHLHVSKEEAKKLKIKNNQKISIKIKGKRSVIFNNIIVRAGEKNKLAFQIDTDEGNAAGIKTKVFGKIKKKKR